MSKDLDTLLPECAGCGRPMMLSRIEPLIGQIGIERRTFECRWCPRTVCYAFDMAHYSKSNVVEAARSVN